jgi:hypothetical protein
MGLYAGAVLALFAGTTERIQAAAAVAAAVNTDGKGYFAYHYGGNSSEAEVRSRALGRCMTSGGLKPKIIASTSKRGYGALVLYYRANRSIGYTASVGAASEREAIEDALRKAKAAGGRTAVVKHTWHDLFGVSEQAINL